MITQTNQPPKIPKSVLFLCSFNAIRSPMAQLLLMHQSGGKIKVDSAGLYCEGTSPMVAEVLAELSPELRDYALRHRPKRWSDIAPQPFDLIITLSDEAKGISEKLVQRFNGNHLHWPTLNPSETEGSHDQQLTAYRMVRDQLLERIKKFPQP